MRLIDADEFKNYIRGALDDVKHLYKDNGAWAKEITDSFCMDIDEQPTFEAEPRWIPCSERLPEESGQYLITVKYEHVDGYEDIYAEHGVWEGEKWDMFCFGHCGKVEDIIAWQPLPEPYRGGDSE